MNSFAKGDQVYDSDGSLLILVKPVEATDEWVAYDPSSGWSVRINHDAMTLAQSAGGPPF